MSRRPPSTAQGGRNEAFVKRTMGAESDRKKVRFQFYVWPVDLARIDALVFGKGGWGTRQGVLAAIFSHGLGPVETEHAVRNRWEGADPAYEQEKVAHHARFVAK